MSATLPPDVTGDDLGDDVVDALVTLGLLEWTEPRRVPGDRVEAIAASARQTGLTCLLGAALERGLVVTDDDARARALDAWSDRLVDAVALDTLLVAVVDRLDAAGIPSRVLKGVAIASLDEPDPSWRSYGDVDVLVPDDRLLDAADALARLGLRPVIPPVSSRWLSRHGKGLTLVHPTGAQVDLHRRLATGPLGSRLDHRALLDTGSSFAVGARQVVALDDAHRFLHACYHAALGGVRSTRHLRDILLLAHEVRPSVVEAAVDEGWSSTVVAAALRWAEPSGALPADWSAWAAGVTPDAGDDALLRSYAGSFRDVAVAEIRSTPGLGAKLAYASALVWPSRGNLAARGETRLGHLRHLIHRTTRRSGGGS